MRLLNVIGSVEIRNGGTTNHVFSISQVWSRLGHECHILCLDPPGVPCVAASPIKTIALGSKGPLYFGGIPFVRYGYTPALVAWLNENARSYDAIILNGLWNYTSIGCWRALRKGEVPYYICPHGMLDPWLKKTDPSKYIMRAIFWRLLESKVVRDARGVIFACEEEKRLAFEGFLRKKAAAHVVAYGAEDSAGYARRKEVSELVPEDRRVILFLGRIHEKKGLDVLIQAFAQIQNEFPEFDLLIVGPDDRGLVQKLVNLASELSVVSRIHWAGMLTGVEKAEAYRRAEFFVLPSHQENFGIAVVEAMASSVPVLITNKVNIWREVEAAGAGFCTTDDVAGLRRGLKIMCSLSPEDRCLMADKARRCFLKQFDLDKNARQFLRVINESRAQKPARENIWRRAHGSARI